MGSTLGLRVDAEHCATYTVGLLGLGTPAEHALISLFAPNGLRCPKPPARTSRPSRSPRSRARRGSLARLASASTVSISPSAGRPQRAGGSRSRRRRSTGPPRPRPPPNPAPGSSPRCVPHQRGARNRRGGSLRACTPVAAIGQAERADRGTGFQPAAACAEEAGDDAENGLWGARSGPRP